jgi:hypothetical protein
MNPFEDTPAPGYKISPNKAPDRMSPDKIHELRARIQAELQQKKPEKEAQDHLEKETFKRFNSYVIFEPLKICNELYNDGVKIDGFSIDVQAAQEAFKRKNKTLPVYPGISTEIEGMIQRKEVAHKKGSFTILKNTNAMLLTSDDKYFQVNVFPSKESMFFVNYDDPCFK